MNGLEVLGRRRLTKKDCLPAALVQHEKFRREQQRAALARALVNRPTPFLTGAPTGNLDSATGESIVVLFRKIRRSLGITIVLFTQDRFFAERIDDRVAYVAEGKLASDAVQT